MLTETQLTPVYVIDEDLDAVVCNVSENTDDYELSTDVIINVKAVVKS